MDADYKFPASPATPLHQVSPERVNQQRCDLAKPPSSESNGTSRHGRESSVQEKAARFESLAFQGKQLERRTNDAALRRAMLGREEAENEMRRYRDEVKALRKQLEEGTARERKVGERLENVMETYGRAKETHVHTQTLWEKEIRRARKESFKSQSAVVKLQEELKAVRNSLRMAQSDLDQEKERSSNREQEAFAARYQLVGVQEELENTAEKMKLVEQERDALKTVAKNEEIARIAAEGRIPLPPSSNDDEFASPKKPSRLSLLPVTLMSAASEEELALLTEKLVWERHRADRAQDHAEYMQMECQLKCCSCQRSEAYCGVTADSSDLAATQVMSNGTAYETEASDRDVCHTLSKATSVSTEDAGPSTQQKTFVPEEGIFKSVLPAPEESPWISPAKRSIRHIQHSNESIVYNNHPQPRASVHARTPSCEPPTFATIQESNTSLLSLLDGGSIESSACVETPVETASTIKEESVESAPEAPADDQHSTPGSQSCQCPTDHNMPAFRTISTTTRIPLSGPADVTPPTNAADLKSALSPTMTREEALAQIRERRGRARSLAQGSLTPRKQMVEGAEPRRDISAPAVRTAARSASRGRNVAR
ncbi:MAG: hypothetical protein M1818_005608 [Claussenomyces sp. TS43310]|nr:MAG: hypothetical protein M1818_005608 [Claussenomyces sp. TS43310]